MATVEILVDGTDYAPIAHFETVRFESLVNGQPGRGYIRLRDDDRTLTFTGGAPVLLKIDGENVWRGFLTQYKRVYIAPALNIAEFGLTRFIDLECTDINILFKNRVVFNQSDPANGYTTLFPAGTSDLTALQDLFANYIDLSGDGLDTTTLVENVADITIDQSGRAINAAQPWSSTMALIAALPGAIWYIDPDKNVVYTDVDTPNAPFGLSDQPNGTTTRGYREMEVLMDGTSLANDVMAWGAGYGSQTPVFRRIRDTDSIATHGVWQRGATFMGVYKQATIDKNAESIIYGSPSNLRGSKDDRVTVNLTTYEPGLRPAQKVDFTSNVFGFTDVIPVRKMVVTFEAYDSPRYDIVLSHEIDPPWSLIDPFFLKFPGIVTPPPPPPPPPPVQNCREICSFTDKFDRIEADGWGRSTSGIGWVVYNGNAPFGPDEMAYTVAPGFGRIERETSGGSGSIDLSLQRQSIDATFVLSNYPVNTNSTFMVVGLTRPTFNSDYYVKFASDNGVLGWEVSVNVGGTDDQQGTDLFTGDPMFVRIQCDATGLRAKVWSVASIATGGVEPGPWTAEVTSAVTLPLDFGFEGDFGPAGREFMISQLSIVGIGAVIIDTFDRDQAATTTDRTYPDGPIAALGDGSIGTPDKGDDWFGCKTIWDGIVQTPTFYVNAVGVFPQPALGGTLATPPDSNPASAFQSLAQAITEDNPYTLDYEVLVRFSGIELADWNGNPGVGAQSAADNFTLFSSGCRAVFGPNVFLGTWIVIGHTAGTWEYTLPSYVPGEEVWLRMHVYLFAGSPHSDIKIWRAVDVEPEAYQIYTSPQFGSTGSPPVQLTTINFSHFWTGNIGALPNIPEPGPGTHYLHNFILTGNCEAEDECTDAFVGLPFIEDLDLLADVLYTTTFPYLSGSLLLHLNGLLQRPDIDYEETDPTTGGMTLLFTPILGDTLRVIYRVAS